MTRLLLSFPIASLASSIVWYLLVALASRQPVGIESIRAIIWLALIILCVASVLGLPMLPVVRRYSMTKYRQVVGLAIAMVLAIASLYTLYAVAMAIGDGASIQQLFPSSLDELAVIGSFLLSIAFLGGSFIWICLLYTSPSPRD